MWPHHWKFKSKDGWQLAINVYWLSSQPWVYCLHLRQTLQSAVLSIGHQEVDMARPIGLSLGHQLRQGAAMLMSFRRPGLIGNWCETLQDELNTWWQSALLFWTRAWEQIVSQITDILMWASVLLANEDFNVSSSSWLSMLRPALCSKHIFFGDSVLCWTCLMLFL